VLLRWADYSRSSPAHLQPLYLFSLSQARHLDVIARFGRYPYRNSMLGRASTSAEMVYLEQGDFVHTRQLPHEPGHASLTGDQGKSLRRGINDNDTS